MILGWVSFTHSLSLTHTYNHTHIHTHTHEDEHTKHKDTMLREVECSELRSMKTYMNEHTIDSLMQAQKQTTTIYLLDDETAEGKWG